MLEDRASARHAGGPWLRAYWLWCPCVFASRVCRAVLQPSHAVRSASSVPQPGAERVAIVRRSD